MELYINAWYCPSCFTQVRGRAAYEAHVQYCWLHHPQDSEDEMREWTEPYWALYDAGVEASRNVPLDGGAAVAAAAAGGAAAAVRGADVAADAARLGKRVSPPFTHSYKKQTLKLQEAAGSPCKKAAVGPEPAAGAAAGGAALRAVAPPRKEPTLVDLIPAGEAAAAAEAAEAGVPDAVAPPPKKPTLVDLAPAGEAAAAAEAAEAGVPDTLVPNAREYFRMHIDRVNAEQRAIMQAAVDADPNIISAIFEPLHHYREAKPPSEVITKTKKDDGNPGPAAKK